MLCNVVGAPLNLFDIVHPMEVYIISLKSKDIGNHPLHPPNSYLSRKTTTINAESPRQNAYAQDLLRAGHRDWLCRSCPSYV
jgi:hypothetical protein